jgi:subtilisin family serine protease
MFGLRERFKREEDGAMADVEKVMFKLVEPGPVQVPGDAASLAKAVEGPLMQVLETVGLPTAAPLLNEVDHDEMQATVDEARAAEPDATVPNPLLAFAAQVAPDTPGGADRVVGNLRGLPLVEWAVVEGEVEGLVTPINNPAFPLQTYLQPAPVGIGAEAAWATSGGDGSGVAVGVVEPNVFDDGHRDLPTIRVLAAPIPLPTTGLAHATAVLGVIAAVDNVDDCVGVAPSSKVLFGSAGGVKNRLREQRLINLIHAVGNSLKAGDVLNISIAYKLKKGLGGNYPLDFRPLVREASTILARRTVTVVQGAGNGTPPVGAQPCSSINLDQAVPAELTPSNSAAIVVGGIQSAGPLGSYVRYECSTFGARVDCCAMAGEVLTLTATVKNSSGAVVRSVETVGGTSFATAIITGVVASMQGIRKARGKPPLKPAEVKAILKDPARTSDPCPKQRVGRMPDLSRIVPAL